MLNDGRILVIEYKGEQYRGTPDVQEKQNLGQLWAQNLVIFCYGLAKEKGLNIYQQLDDVLRK